MQERGISVDELYEVWENINTTSVPSDKQSEVVVLTGKTAKGRRIRIVASGDETVITAYVFSGKR
ncbi:hypothetical protein AGMMS49938_04130 [Fibrobacterales bacterium]|nr:hypothetical protein AGMMS49938_04130 [Fibrobacterales bacterium]